MTIREIVARTAILSPLALLGLASGLRCQACWGFNHLMFLSPTWWWVYWAVSATAVVLLFAPLPDQPFARACESIGRVLFGPRCWPRLLFALVAMAAFWLLRAKTHFLGDGYTQLAVFGQGYEFTGRWTAPLAGWIVAQVQGLLGAYTWDTAERAFQTVSIVSGGGYTFVALNLSRLLWEDTTSRVAASTALLGGGGIMLFFGYVEVYAVLWASAMLFLWLSARVLRENGSILWPILALALVVSVHLQALYLVPVIVCLAAIRYGSPLGDRAIVVMASATVALGVAFWALKEGLAWPDILMDVSDPGHGYGLFSGKHLLDIINEAVLVAPLLPVWLAIGDGALSSRFERAVLPGVVVATGFLFLIRPALGMARDWDLMSFPVLLIAIWLLSRKPHRRISISPRSAAAALLVSTMFTLSFVGANLSTEGAERRFRSLIEYYGDFDDTGWAILTTYFLNTGQDETALKLVDEMEMRGIRPEESAHVTARLLRKRGRLGEAERHYRRAIAAGGFAPHVKNELGQLYMSQGRYRDAIDVFLQAHREAPRLTFIAEGLGLAYFHAGIGDTAQMYADTLFRCDPNSPGGHLLAMVIAIRQGRMDTARYHYQEYLKHGRRRSDYDRIRQYYGPILDD